MKCLNSTRLSRSIFRRMYVCSRVTHPRPWRLGPYREIQNINRGKSRRIQSVSILRRTLVDTALEVVMNCSWYKPKRKCLLNFHDTVIGRRGSLILLQLMHESSHSCFWCLLFCLHVLHVRILLLVNSLYSSFYFTYKFICHYCLFRDNFI